MTDLLEIAQAVRQHRKKLKLTQARLAKQSGVSRALLQELEAERLGELGIRKLTRILNALGLDLRLTSFNLKRPTLEDLLEEEEGQL